MTKDELDSEIQKLFSSGEPDLTPDETTSPNETVGTLVDMIDKKEEKTIPESRYKAAVVAMNKAQQEAAAFRKENSALKEQLISTMNASNLEEIGEVEGSDEVEKTLADIFPEVLEYINAKVMPRISALENKSGDFESVANEYKQKKQAEQDEHDAKFWAAIRKAHSDIEQYLAVSGTPYSELTEQQRQYSDWYAEQDDVVKGMLFDPDPEVVNEALDIFKESLPEKSLSPETEETESTETPEEDNVSSVVVAVGANPKPSKIEQARQEATPSVVNQSRRGRESMPLSLEEIRSNPKSYLSRQDEYLNS